MRFWQRWAAGVVDHPGRVWFWLVVMVLPAFWGLSRLEVKTSNFDLVDPGDPEVARLLAFNRDFGGINPIVWVVSGSDPKLRHELVDQLAHFARQHTLVKGVVERWPNDRGQVDFLDGDGLSLVLVQPRDQKVQASLLKPLIADLEAWNQSQMRQFSAVNLGLTGIPVYAVADQTSIQTEVSQVSVWSLIGVLILFMLGFHRFFHPLLAVGVLCLVVLVSVGWTAIWPGYLTHVSGTFASILIGLGVDFSIHFIHRLEQMPQADWRERVKQTIAVSGPALATGALTSAAVFLSLLGSGFQGFSELGWIAGGGLLICLIATTTVLPLLLLRTRPLPQVSPQTEWTLPGYFAWPLLVGGLLLGAWRNPGFDSNYLSLQPQQSSAVFWEKQLVEHSDWNTQFMGFRVNDLQAWLTLKQKLRNQASVGRVLCPLQWVELQSDPLIASLAQSLLATMRSPQGDYPVFVFPRANVWNAADQTPFLEDMQAIDAQTTGMPLLGKVMVDKTHTALRRTAIWGSLAILLVLILDFRKVRLILLACLVPALTLWTLKGLMAVLGLSFNPLNVMAVPLILGIAVDDGVHLLHRTQQEGGRVASALGGTGRSIVLTSLTTLCAFGMLALTANPGLASFGLILVLGVGLALVFSLLVLPVMMKLFPIRRLAP
ncbi:MAG: MMPL family transporter [Acidobacteria bacterium]|nr:MMPL family transporter [Acidobacteriota bacterium]MCB9398852.1 MMPL family transporter [Acidobacteriota bacterium]